MQGNYLLGLILRGRFPLTFKYIRKFPLPSKYKNNN
jgi:hypothetical protein